jgi:hypothetical protein
LDGRGYEKGLENHLSFSNEIEKNIVRKENLNEKQGGFNNCCNGITGCTFKSFCNQPGRILHRVMGISVYTLLMDV